MGKAEGQYTNWHGHVTAVTVAPSYRRLGLAKMMMDELERVTDKVYRGYFVDLFVRVSNEIAINMYERLGYSVYRRVVEYYSGGGFGDGGDDEDAFGECCHDTGLFVGKEVGSRRRDADIMVDMRKPMSRDKRKESIRENGRDYHVSPEEVWF